jgi:hypothetical protein
LIIEYGNLLRDSNRYIPLPRRFPKLSGNLSLSPGTFHSLDWMQKIEFTLATLCIGAMGSSSETAQKEIDMNAERTNIGWGFWLVWILASIMGFVMGALLGMSVAYGLFDRDGFDATIGITAGIAIGATAGCLQWVVLREKVARVGWWVLASTLGFAIAFGTLGAIGIGESNENYVMAGILFAAVFGIAGGILQWLVLRQAGIARAGLWVPASIFGSLVAAIGFPISSAIGATGNYGLSAMVFGLLLGAGLGAIPGVVLVWLLHQSPSSNIEGLAAAH